MSPELYAPGQHDEQGECYSAPQVNRPPGIAIPVGVESASGAKRVDHNRDSSDYGGRDRDSQENAMCHAFSMSTLSFV
jgi:hypothetical protein